MPYISELLNNRITDNTDTTVGKLKDILISPKPGGFPPLEYLEIKAPGSTEPVFVPYEFVQNFSSSHISLKTMFGKVVQRQLPERNFIRLKQDVLDKQIVDVAGTRVVRVNDLRIGFFENKMCVLGIDPSFRGILRRLGLGDSLLAQPFKVELIDWRQAEQLEGGPLQLNTAVSNLSRLHPADLANIVEDLDVKQGSSLLASLDAEEAAKVMEELDPQLQSVLAQYLGPEASGKILGKMSSDEATDLVKSLNREEAGKFLAKIQGMKAKSVEKLIRYEDNTAGGLMTLDFISARPDWTVDRVIQEIKQASPHFRSVVFVYVVDTDNKFLGVVSLRRLLLAETDMTMQQLLKTLTKASTLKPGDRIEKVIQVMTKYNLFSAAVVDQEGKLAGVVTIDDVMRYLFPNA